MIRVAVETLLLVFIDPIREGRPRPRTWPRGLPPVGLLVLGAYVAVSAMIIAAPMLRRIDPLVPVGDGLFLGAWTITALHWVTSLVLATAVTGLLHVHHAVRWPALLLISLTLVMFVPSSSGTVATVAGAASIIGLWVFALLRLGRSYAAVEFAVVLVLISVVVTGVQWGGSDLGVDGRGPTLLLALSTLYVLAMPVLTMAGFAFAEVAVDLAERASDRLAAHASVWWLRGLSVIALLLVLAQAVRGVLAEEWPWRARAWLDTSAVVGVVALLAGLVLWIGWSSAHPWERPVDAVPRWRRLAWPMSLLMVANAFPVSMLAGVEAIGQLLGRPRMGLADAAGSETVVAWVRLIAAAVALWLAARAAGRGDRSGGVVLAAFSTLSFASATAMATGGRWTIVFSPLVAGVLLAVVAFVVALVRWRVAAAWGGALGVLLLTALYPVRTVLAEPTTLVGGISAAAVLFLGLVWRVLTDAKEFAQRGSRGFPLASRVLLYLANGLFGAIALAYAALVRTHDSSVDVEAFTELGDRAIGAPLFLGVALLGLVFTALTERRPPEVRLGPVGDPR